MRQFKNVLLCVCCVLFISACSSSPSDQQATNDSLRSIMDEYITECTFKDGTTPAPKWVCGYPLDEFPVTETGYSGSALEAEARADAFVKLAARIQTRVENTAEASVTSSGQRNRSEFEQVSKQVASERLTNTRVLLRIIDPSTRGLHVLVMADEQAFDDAVQQARMRILE